MSIKISQNSQEKQLCWSLFLIILQAWRWILRKLSRLLAVNYFRQTLKLDSSTCFFTVNFVKFFKNTIFLQHVWVTAFVSAMATLLCKHLFKVYSKSHPGVIIANLNRFFPTGWHFPDIANIFKITLRSYVKYLLFLTKSKINHAGGPLIYSD